VLQDTAGNPVYDVEVFGTDIQPYIGQVYAYVKDAGGASSANFIAIQLINPYPVPIPVTANWGLATIDRSKTGLIAGQPGLTLTSVLTPAGTQMTPFTIPAATAADARRSPGLVLRTDTAARGVVGVGAEVEPVGEPDAHGALCVAAGLTVGEARHPPLGTRLSRRGCTFPRRAA